MMVEHGPLPSISEAIEDIESLLIPNLNKNETPQHKIKIKQEIPATKLTRNHATTNPPLNPQISGTNFGKRLAGPFSNLSNALASKWLQFNVALHPFRSGMIWSRHKLITSRLRPPPDTLCKAEQVGAGIYWLVLIRNNPLTIYCRLRKLIIVTLLHVRDSIVMVEIVPLSYTVVMTYSIESKRV